MRTLACLLLLAAAAMAAGCVNDRPSPPPSTAGDGGAAVKHVGIGMAGRAWFSLESSGKASGGHVSGDPQRPFVHQDEKQLDPAVVKEIMDLAAEVYRSPAPSEPAERTPGWYIRITPTSGPAKYYLEPKGPYTDEALERLHQLLLKHHIGAW